MTSFLSLKKKKKVSENINLSTNKSSVRIEDLLPKDTTIVIPDIDIAFLDKEYVMKDFKESAEKTLLNKDNLTKNNDFISVGEDNISIQLKTPNTFFKKEKKILSGYGDTKINLKKINEKNDLDIKSKVESKNINAKANLKNITTKLENLGITKENGLINTFVINESIQIKFHSTLNTDVNSQIHCWWCKHLISKNYKPLGCPIKYVKQMNNEEEYFETDGWFCCFNCIVAYINEVSLTQIRYRESSLLVYLLYYKIFNKTIKPGLIKPSPDWRLLKIFGGNLSIDEYRSIIQVNEISLNWTSRSDNQNDTGTISDKNNYKLINNTLNYIEEISKKNN
jgi:hypothetical protein